MGHSGPSYAENDTGVVATYEAASLMADSAAWSLEGDDADHLMIEGSGRSVMLKFMSPPDYEMPMDMGMDNTYMVILKASAGTDEATRHITVTVTNDEDKGMVELSSLTPVVDVPLTATLMDPDGSITGETWQWSKSMTMDGVFTQIGGATMASYTPVAADDGYHLMVEVTYTDGYGTGKDTEMATTGMVTTVPDQPGEVSLSSMTPVVGTELTASLTDRDGSVTGETWMWYKSMDSTFMDGTEMEIAGATSMSYTPMAADEGYYLMVKVMYTDGHGSGKEAMATTTGMVTTVPDQMGTVRLSSMSPVVGAMLTATLTDPDGGVTGETWQWSKSTTMGGTFMDIAGATSMSYTPMAADEGYYLRATVMYTDAHGPNKEEMATTTGMVTTVQDQMGSVRLSSMTPMVGAMLTATLTDPDGGVTGATWQWSKSTTLGGSFMDIAGATSMSYTPMAADEGYYLMAKAMYTDGHGSGKMAMATSANAVTAGDPLVARYDANNNGEIEKSEVIAAINDYLFGEGDATISKADVIRLINMYLFPNG